MKKCIELSTKYLANGALKLDGQGVPIENTTDEWTEPWTNDG
jgi:hypothetical protein